MMMDDHPPPSWLLPHSLIRSNMMNVSVREKLSAMEDKLMHTLKESLVKTSYNTAIIAAIKAAQAARTSGNIRQKEGKKQTLVMPAPSSSVASSRSLSPSPLTSPSPSLSSSPSPSPPPPARSRPSLSSTSSLPISASVRGQHRQPQLYEWSAAEDNHLTDVMMFARYQEAAADWEQVAAAFNRPRRTAADIKERWNHINSNNKQTNTQPARRPQQQAQPQPVLPSQSQRQSEASRLSTSISGQKRSRDASTIDEHSDSSESDGDECQFEPGSTKHSRKRSSTPLVRKEWDENEKENRPPTVIQQLSFSAFVTQSMTNPQA